MHVVEAISCTVPSAAPSGSKSTSTTLECSGTQLSSNATGLVLLAVFLVAAGVVVFAILFLARRTADADGNQVPIITLPYMTWFLIHFGIPALGILAITGLAFAGAIDATVVSALFGSLFGYVLGASATRGSGSSSRSTTSSGSDAVRDPSISAIYPSSVPFGAPTPVVLTGSNLATDGPAPTVKFGDTAADGVHVASSGAIWVTPPTAAAASQVSVEVSIKNKVINRPGLKFHYT